MSATGRGVKRKVHDNYPTPAWTTRLLLNNVPLPGGDWLEPCAGNGAIIREVDMLRDDVKWSLCEIRRSCVAPPPQPYLEPVTVVFGDFLKTDLSTFGRRDRPFDVILTNPPFSFAQEFLEHSLAMAHVVALLLRLNFLEGARRSVYLSDNMPTEIYVLPTRPSFCQNKLGRWATDATAYAWMIWREDGRQTSNLSLLPTVPLEDRRA